MEPLTTSIEDAAAALGVGKTFCYSLINSGQLETVKLGRRTLVKVESLRRLVGVVKAAA